MAVSKCDNHLCACLVTDHTTSPSFCSDACRHVGPGATECPCGHPECAQHDVSQRQIR